MRSTEVLAEAAARPLEGARLLRDSLTDEVLNAHPGGHDNSIAWLLWHTGREIDVQVAHLAGGDQLWERDRYDERFGLGDIGSSIGYGHTTAEARSIVVADPDLLLDYLQAVTGALVGYTRGLSESDLDDVIDDSYDPPVTRGVRIISIIDDAAQHVGQASYAAGMLG